MSSNSAQQPEAASANARLAPRDENAIYQNGRVVARVLDAQIELERRAILFGEVYNSDELLLPDDCEFRGFRILIQHMDFATREERDAAHKGRVLRGVTADILGYLEQ
jgi:hypothetical protein